LVDLLSVGTGSYVRTGANGSATAPPVAGNPASPQAGQFWYDSASNNLKFYNGTSVQTVGTTSSGVQSVTASTGLTGGTITGTGTIAVDVGTTAGKSYRFRRAENFQHSMHLILPIYQQEI
jgi:hypothetical protein